MTNQPPSQKSSQWEGLFSPRSPIEFIGFALINMVIGLASAGNPLSLGLIPVFAFAWWAIDWQRGRRQRDQTGFSLTKKAPQPAKGLILLLSPYSVKDPALANPMTLNPLIEALLQNNELSDRDFDSIGLWQSNLVPQIRAIDYHYQQGELREVWLITTESYEQVKGSEVAALILERYLSTFINTDRLLIHREGKAIREYDYNGLWQLGEQIFRRSGYRNELLLADITGGNKMMSVAIAMACIAPGRRMQYMDSKRDWQGNPVPQGEMSPIVIDIDPILYQDNGTG